MKVAVFSSKSYDSIYLNKANEKHGFEIDFHESSLNRKSVRLAHGSDAVCAFVNDRIDRPTLEALHSQDIRLVALRCAGFNNVDLETAAELGVRIMRVPAYSPHAVAEHAVALILTLNRKTHKAFNRVRDANFSLERFVGFDLQGKTVGVIGTGKIGQAFSEIMMGFGCPVIAYDLHKNKALEERGVEYASVQKVFEQSDILSLHCPLTPQTHQVVNKTSLLWMKKGAMLINTSRGKLINTQDVIDALRAKRLGYLGIDVYAEEEKLFFRDLSEHIIDDEMIMQLMTFPNVLITAHQGFLTHEALTQIAETTLENIRAHSEGRTNDNEVTIEVMR